MSSRKTILIGSVFGFLSVAIGAFAAHGLKLEGYEQNVFEIGVRYQFYHALALMIVGLIGLQKPQWVHDKIATLWSVGIILFSGSLYGIALIGEKKLGMITPLGGICFLAGWLLLIIRLSKREG